MLVTGMGPSCCVHGCLKPVRELGGYCYAHWAGLSPLQRQSLRDDEAWGVGKGDTEEIDSLSIAEACELEAILDVPWDENRRAA